MTRIQSHMPDIMSSSSLTFALAQINPCVGDLSGNCDKIITFWEDAQSQDADLCILPEMALTGYPLQDLVLNRGFLEDCQHYLDKLIALSHYQSCDLLLSMPYIIEKRLCHAALLIEKGQYHIIAVKQTLPNYDVFDEQRVFQPGQPAENTPFLWRGIALSTLICEDMWHDQPIEHIQTHKSDLLISLNASPYQDGKQAQRLKVMQHIITHCQKPLLASFLVGGQDELVFDGGSQALDRDGHVIAAASYWQEDICMLQYDLHTQRLSALQEDKANWMQADKMQMDYQALVIGLRDYVKKNGFDSVCLGLSGGVDSALVACVAVDALGADKVNVLIMPSCFNSDDSMQDAQELVQNLGIQSHILPIEPLRQSVQDMLSNVYSPHELQSLVSENIQARLRGLLLMAHSNQTNALLLTTGNKSEMATGYATLYGDMCGGFNPLKDVYKTQVWALCHWRNRCTNAAIEDMKLKGVGNDAVIPENIITKAPSAELRPNQTDEDSLPAYDILDKILYHLIENNGHPADSYCQEHFPSALVERVASLLKRSEYKRQQAAPGVTISTSAMRQGRRYPLTNKYCYQKSG